MLMNIESWLKGNNDKLIIFKLNEIFEHLLLKSERDTYNLNLLLKKESEIILNISLIKYFKKIVKKIFNIKIGIKSKGK